MILGFEIVSDLFPQPVVLIAQGGSTHYSYSVLGARGDLAQASHCPALNIS